MHLNCSRTLSVSVTYVRIQNVWKMLVFFLWDTKAFCARDTFCTPVTFSWKSKFGRCFIQTLCCFVSEQCYFYDKYYDHGESYKPYPCVKCVCQVSGLGGVQKLSKSFQPVVLDTCTFAEFSREIIRDFCFALSRMERWAVRGRSSPTVLAWRVLRTSNSTCRASAAPSAEVIQQNLSPLCCFLGRARRSHVCVVVVFVQDPPPPGWPPWSGITLSRDGRGLSVFTMSQRALFICILSAQI